MNKYFVIFVEGLDDKRFFQTVIEPIFRDKDYHVIVWNYQNEQPRRIRNFIRTIHQTGGDYIFTTDIDQSPCITYKKTKVRNRYPRVDSEKIAVVVKEIESWYLAVIDHQRCPVFLRKCCYPCTGAIC